MFTGIGYYTCYDDSSKNLENIEYQISFKGTLKECENKKLEHQSHLREKIKELEKLGYTVHWGIYNKKLKKEK